MVDNKDNKEPISVIPHGDLKILKLVKSDKFLQVPLTMIYLTNNHEKIEHDRCVCVCVCVCDQ